MHRVIEAQDARLIVKEQLRKARALRKKKHSSHKRYLRLKKEKKKLTRAQRDEFKELLVVFRELSAVMREAEQALRGSLDARDRQSKQFLAGLKAGREEARMQQIQAQLDREAQPRRRFRNDE